MQFVRSSITVNKPSVCMSTLQQVVLIIPQNMFFICRNYHFENQDWNIQALSDLILVFGGEHFSVLWPDKGLIRFWLSLDSKRTLLEERLWFGLNNLSHFILKKPTLTVGGKREANGQSSTFSWPIHSPPSADRGCISTSFASERPES